LAIASIFKGDEDTAKYNIRRIRELNQQTKWTRVAAGFIEGLGQDYEGGKYQLSRAMEEGADRSLVYLCRGFIHEKHRNFDLAKKEMESYRGIVRTDEQGQPYKELALRVKRNECVANDGRFCKYQDGTVLDTSTNLMWAAKDNGSDINWQNAKRYCENYRGGGYTDWRMPTQDELAGLYDESKRNQHGYRVTNLIEITRCCPWASETRGSDAAYVVFDGFRRDWSHQSDAYVLRALPVRSGK
jgi:hypothetical protein